MFLIKKPSKKYVKQFLARQAPLEYSYSEIGATAKESPPGYFHEHTKVKLGEGEAVFANAKDALKNWRQFSLSWVELHNDDVVLHQGQTVAILARGLFGIWTLNACRVIYIVEEEGPVRRFGFANGTLPEHIGAGEERFLIEWNRADNSVWYEIRAFSRPQHFLGKLFYPYLRYKQRQFKRESAMLLQQFVNNRESGFSD